MEKSPETVSIDEPTRATFKAMMSAVVAKEKTEGATANFMYVENFRIEDLTDEDIIMFFRVKEYAGYELPTYEELAEYNKKVIDGGNPTRGAFGGYLNNIATKPLMRRELEKLEAQKGLK